MLIYQENEDERHIRKINTNKIQLEHVAGSPAMAKPARHLVMYKCKFFCVYRPYKESISTETNNNNDLNLHLHDQMSGWLRYWSPGRALSITMLDSFFFMQTLS